MREIRTFGSAGVSRPKRHSLKQPSLEAAFLPTRACPLSQPLSAFVRQVVGQWANTHEVPLTDPPAIWYEDAEIPSLAEQEKAAPEAKEERTHYPSPKKGGPFHGTV